jgi:3-oxoacyl-[acyl-carrier protein] reductase
MLDSKIALVTGASKGIGKAIALKLAENGAFVYANSRESDNFNDWAKDTRSEVRGQIEPIYFDVTDEQACKAAILQIKKEKGGLDILINNAGIVSYEMLGMVSTPSFREMLEVNVVAPLNLIQLCNRIMAKRSHPSIINITSIVAEKGVEGQVAYASSKGAIISMTKSAAKELATKGIRVNAIAPGMVSTERLVEAAQRGFENKINDIRMGRMVTPEEVADLCVFLSSDSSKSITGQVIGIDGSMKL